MYVVYFIYLLKVINYIFNYDFPLRPSLQIQYLLIYFHQILEFDSSKQELFLYFLCSLLKSIPLCIGISNIDMLVLSNKILDVKSSNIIVVEINIYLIDIILVPPQVGCILPLFYIEDDLAPFGLLLSSIPLCSSELSLLSQYLLVPSPL